MDNRKVLKTMYKQTPLQAGAFQIKSKVNGKVFVTIGKNLPGMFNSHRFRLNANSHSNKALQEDWNALGPDAFSFDILETLKTETIAPENLNDALRALEQKWLDTLQPYDERGYNKKKEAK